MTRLGIRYAEWSEPNGWFDRAVRRPVQAVVYPAWTAPIIAAVLSLAIWKVVDLLLAAA